MISPELKYEKRSRTVDGVGMAYIEAGEGDPIVFLHGNPTSSYLWRNVIPYLEDQGRCIAPDLVGMGDSDKLADSGPGSYRFVEHRGYLAELLSELGVSDNVTLVLHDWGAALGLDWANQHRDAVKAIAYMEGVVKTISWDDFPQPVAPVFKAFRSPEGEAMILEQNTFVEQVLPGAVLRKLSEAEMEQYRRPFSQPGEGRRPTLTWPREIPIDGDPGDVAEIVSSYGDWMEHSSTPKLLINAEPGALIRGAVLDYCRTWPNQEEVTVNGVHFVQEDSPDEIGRAISDWLAKLS
ncbi:MAG: haloalkane dehalogenase [Candidatus Binatia bacterium]